LPTKFVALTWALIILGSFCLLWGLVESFEYQEKTKSAALILASCALLSMGFYYVYKVILFNKSTTRYEQAMIINSLPDF
jgi:hypothetical protein